jgi:hypothetical protein
MTAILMRIITAQVIKLAVGLLAFFHCERTELYILIF